MGLIRGVTYNLRGLWLGIKTPKLLLLGLVRFTAVLVLTVVAASLILYYHNDILTLFWVKPASLWLVWLWYVFAWLLSLLLVGFSAVVSYLVAQVLFSVIIMDYMSRITEKMMTGRVEQPVKLSLVQQFFYLVRQEFPRAILPLAITLLLVVLGWLTPVGPIVAIASVGIAVVFLAWDNTDLVPARRFYPFRTRFQLLSRSITFHLGFGLLFLVPVLNIVVLSFASVGGTMYFTEKENEETRSRE